MPETPENIYDGEISCECYDEGINKGVADTEARMLQEGKEAYEHIVAGLNKALAAERAATKALVALFKRLLPKVFVCVECGPFMKSDEDGCCIVCGSDGAIIVPFDAAYVAYKERHDGG